MIAQVLIAVFLILVMLAGWIVVQHLARAFAAKHPEFGPAREEGESCGGLFCFCDKKANCPKYIFKNKGPSRSSQADTQNH